MDDSGDVERPARQKAADELGEPEHETGAADGEHPPEDGNEVELFPVSPALEGRLRPPEQEPAHHADDVGNVAQVRTERIRPEKALQKVPLAAIPIPNLNVSRFMILLPPWPFVSFASASTAGRPSRHWLCVSVYMVFCMNGEANYYHGVMRKAHGNRDSRANR